MTGIERLRKLSEDFTYCRLWYALISGTEEGWGCYQGDDRTVSDELLSIADQIERERACDADTIENIRLIVGVVIDDMERHVSGVEGMEDSPVARRARELREALGRHCRDGEGDTVAGSPCDGRADEGVMDVATVRADAMEAWEWVREHGGLDHVKAEWRSRVPYDLYERRRQRLLGHIAECETALGRRNVRIEELGRRVGDLTRENAELRKRSMPEGCEWPRYESGESVGLGDDVSRNGEDFEANVIALYRDGSFSLNFWAYSRGERVKRPAPKVLDADGVEIRVGDTVYHVKDGSEMTVFGIEGEWLVVSIGSLVRHDMVTHRASVLAADGEPLEVGQMVWDVRGIRQFRVLSITSDGEHGEYTVETVGVDRMGLSGWSKPSDLTHQRPVLDADGVPIREGDEVHAIWNFTGHSYVVEDASNPLEIAVRAKEYPDQRTTLRAKNLTHAKPAIDSWERIEEDATKNPFDYCKDVGHRLDTCENAEAYKARDLVLRAKKLAGVDND